MVRTNYVLIGNPGSGKSTLMNCYVGAPLFRSGVSRTGAGVTYQLDVSEHNGDRYMDTPGLSDMQLRRKAATAIDAALKVGGVFRLFFVITLESGRIKPDDLTTIKLVLEASNQIRDEEFSIIVNKNTKGFMKKLIYADMVQVINESLERVKAPKTHHIHFAPTVPDLDDEDDVIVDLPYQTQEFFKNAPMIYVDGEKTQQLKAESFDEVQQKVCEQQQQLDRARAALDAEKAALDAEKALRARQLREAEQERQRQLREAEQERQRQLRAAEEQRQMQQRQAAAALNAEKAALDAEKALRARQLREAEQEKQRQLRAAEEQRQMQQRQAALREQQLREGMQNFQNLCNHILNKDWCNFNKLGTVSSADQIVESMRSDMPTERQFMAHKVVCWKGKATASNIFTLGISSGIVQGYYVLDSNNNILHSGGSTSNYYRCSGSWAYRVDCSGYSNSWSMSKSSDYTR